MIKFVLIIISLAGLGLTLYLLLGKNQKQWNEMTDYEQKRKKILIASGISVFLAGLIAALTIGKRK
jgi:hypothetical protein